MFILRFINDDDDLSVKEFVSLADLKEYINQKNLEKTWHQMCLLYTSRLHIR